MGETFKKVLFRFYGSKCLIIIGLIVALFFSLSKGARTANFVKVYAITVTTDPSGLTIIVDWNTYTAPRTFNWTEGSVHSIAVSSPQSKGFGTHYVYDHWSDGGAQSHQITVPAHEETYTAYFNSWYFLSTSVDPGGSGTIDRAPPGDNGGPDGAWYNSGELVQLTANPNSEYQFDHWSGDLSGSTNPDSIIMNSPKSVIANFLKNWAIIVATDPPGMTITADGNDYLAPDTFHWLEGSAHTIGVSSPQVGPGGLDYHFSHWSDGGDQTHQMTVPPHNETYTAYFASTDIKDFPNEEGFPNDYRLSQNYPNPFNPNTQIQFGLPTPSYTKIEVFNVLGKKVITLVDEFLSAGYKTVYWDGKDENGNQVSSGIYFYRLETEDFTCTRKMVLTK